jgi:phytoene synthase
MPTDSNLLSAREITHNAKSNLAFALVGLPKQRKEDMITFYAFCRTIDDYADDEGLPIESRINQLLNLKSIISEKIPTDQTLWQNIILLKKRYSIPEHELLGIIDGMISDLYPVKIQTHAQLLDYCYQVASLVGLVSIKIFGCTHPSSVTYSIHLGYALQLTNIIRDVGEDYQLRNRIYIPADSLQEFQVTSEMLNTKEVHPRLYLLLQYYTQQALAHYQIALQHLTAQDFKPLVAARIMADIYQTLLIDLQKNQFPVLTQRFKLSKFHKIIILLTNYFQRN